jgi:choline dehydrogenase-like flavoprotein
MAEIADRKVTKADIEAKLRDIRGDVDETAAAARPYLLIAGAVGAVVLLGAAYLLGRRKGKKKTTVVEIRRV